MINYDDNKANICTKLLKDYFKLEGSSAEVLYPNNIESKSIEHIYYLFYSCLLDYGMNSKIYHNNLINTYKVHPNIFNPNYVYKNYKDNSKLLSDIIKNNIHPRYPNVALKKWLYLSEYLSKEDLLTKLKNINSYNELYNYIISIKGYGQKTGGLLIRLLVEIKICNIDLLNIPIDRHDIEISYLNGIIDSDKLNNDEISKLGTIWVNSALINGITPIDIDKYLWTIGSKLCVKKMCNICPLNVNCKQK